MIDIRDLMDRPVRKLAGGNQRRIEIARVLLSQPKLLLLDEPSAGLDSTARLALVKNLRGIVKAHGMTILWATSSGGRGAEAGRIMLLMRGKITNEGPPGCLDHPDRCRRPDRGLCGIDMGAAPSGVTEVSPFWG